MYIITDSSSSALLLFSCYYVYIASYKYVAMCYMHAVYNAACGVVSDTVNIKNCVYKISYISKTEYDQKFSWVINFVVLYFCVIVLRCSLTRNYQQCQPHKLRI